MYPPDGPVSPIMYATCWFAVVSGAFMRANNNAKRATQDDFFIFSFLGRNILPGLILELCFDRFCTKTS